MLAVVVVSAVVALVVTLSMHLGGRDHPEGGRW